MKLGQRRTLSGNIAIDRGTFYNGHKTTLSMSREAAEPRIAAVDRADYRSTGSIWPKGRSGTAGRLAHHLHDDAADVHQRAAAVQLQRHDVSANVRLRWEYRPGSELFVVFNEDRDTLAPPLPRSADRALIVKINRLFRP